MLLACVTCIILIKNICMKDVVYIPVTFRKLPIQIMLGLPNVVAESPDDHGLDPRVVASLAPGGSALPVRPNPLS